MNRKQTATPPPSTPTNKCRRILAPPLANYNSKHHNVSTVPLEDWRFILCPRLLIWLMDGSWPPQTDWHKIDLAPQWSTPNHKQLELWSTGHRQLHYQCAKAGGGRPISQRVHLQHNNCNCKEWFELMKKMTEWTWIPWARLGWVPLLPLT